MPSWDEVQATIKGEGSIYDVVRRGYIKDLSDLTGRNVIVYYSGWMEKEQLIRAGLTGYEVNDEDKNGFMATVHGLDRSKGLDLVLHTPGGDIAATESLVDYLRSMFGRDIRVVVPQLAMSAGTMIALAARQIVMGKHSSLGPIDPQIGGIAAHGVVEEFEKARNDIKSDPATVAIWQPIIAKYTPTLVGECQKGIDWANTMVKEWLLTGVFEGDPEANAKADLVIQEFGDHSLTLSHARHISSAKAAACGLDILNLESDQGMQEGVLTIHHACIQTMGETPAFKIIENQNGVSFITSVNGRPAP